MNLPRLFAFDHVSLLLNITRLLLANVVLDTRQMSDANNHHTTAMATFPMSSLEGSGEALNLSTTTISSPLSPDVEVPPATVPVPKSRKRRQSCINHQANGREGSNDTSRMLACLSCRQKKIKCYRDSSTCGRCKRLQIQCVVPDEDERLRRSSKTHTRELERQIERLEKRLQEAEERAQRNLYLLPPSSSEPSNGGMDLAMGNDLVEKGDDVDLDQVPQNLIARLCAEKSHYNTDESGRVRYYGPTSSLHTSEKVSYNFLKWDEGTLEPDEQDVISPTLRDHLLEQYWHFQHKVLQVVHREAFLQDMQTGRSRYYSKALLYAILANAAVFSEVPEIRALALSKDEDPEGSKPYLLRKATEMTEHELENNVGVTTIQSLQLLSSLHCRRGADTKGWLESGRSSRLIFELGLHKDDAEFQSSTSSPMDLEVRRVVFWGCFTYDRGWSLYLGRPCAINLDDVTISPPSLLSDHTSSYSTDLSILLAWATLFTIVGDICNALNKKPFTYNHLQALRQTLLIWESSLDPSLRHTLGCTPAISVLQLQFHAAMILLHRSTARFGTSQTETTPTSRASRAICVDHVLQIAQILADYRTSHGSARTLLGTALYNVALAAVVLIAIRVEQSSEASTECLSSLTICIATLEDLQLSFASAKPILKQLRYLMRRCKLLNLKEDSQALRDANASLLQRRTTYDAEVDSPPVKLLGQILRQDWSSDDATMFMDPGQFMPALEDCETLTTMGIWHGSESVFL